MWYGLLGLAAGIILGVFVPLSIPVEFARYTAVGILGILDSILGAIRADLQKKYNPMVFVSGLITNMLLAALITFLGDRLGLDLYLAVLVAFTIRMLNNMGIIRYSFLTSFLGRREVEAKIQEKTVRE